MRRIALAFACLGLLAACGEPQAVVSDPAAVNDQAVGPVVEAQVPHATPPASVTYPQATGPVANYFTADMPVTYRGLWHWSKGPRACAVGSMISVEARTIVLSDIAYHLGDIEVNQSRGQIIDVVATTLSGTRVLMKLSTDGGWLHMTTMGPPLDLDLSDLPKEFGRCA